MHQDNQLPTAPDRTLTAWDTLSEMDRRTFLQCTAGGMLLSVFAGRTAGGATAQDVLLVSNGLALTLRVNEGTAVELRSLKNTQTGFEWCHEGTALEPVLVTARGPHTKWTVQAGKQRKNRFEFGARHSTAPITARYALQGLADVPIAEIRLEFQNVGTQPIPGMTAFGALRFRLRDDLGPLKIHGSGPSCVEATEKNEFLLVGVEWATSSCRITEEKDGRWLNVEVSGAMRTQEAPPMTHDLMPGERFPVPRLFLGSMHGDATHALLTVRRYLQTHVFPKPLKNWPWVHYNFWGTEAEGVQEALLREIDVAADLGIELITHDAAWYKGSAKTGKKDDWGTGLGHYTDDRVKYPMGLAAISQRIHAKGMKFGLWVGPNIVDPRIVGSIIREEWLCKADGKLLAQGSWGYAHRPVQVCFGASGYIEFLKREMAGIVERFQLDVLRWDNSGMVGPCNRTDHGHQAGDWAYAWRRGQCEIFEYLHAKFPRLVIELAAEPDYGIARSVRAFGGDLRSGIGVAESSSAFSLYPSSYTGAWLVTPPEGTDAELDAMFRAQMAAWFGFATYNGVLRQRVGLYPKAVLQAAQRNIPLYKRFRHLLNEDCHLLSINGWSVVEYATPNGDEAVVLAFRNANSDATASVPLQALAPNRMYDLTFANTGAQTTLAGTDLLRGRLRLSLAQPVMSEVIMLRARP